MAENGVEERSRASHPLIDSSLETAIERPEGFDYEILKRTSWLVRRVEAWSYTGDALWERKISFDVDMGQLLKLRDRCKYKSKFFLLPLFEFDKGKQLVEFDARDRFGNPMHLILREHSAQYALSALRGAITTEHGTGSVCHLPELKSENMLSEVLGALFGDVDLPKDENGKDIRYDDEDCLEKIVNTIKNELLKTKDKYSKQSAEEAISQLEQYINYSPIFRYFLITYTFKWTPCLRVEFGDREQGESANTIIKVRLNETKDIITQQIPITKKKDKIKAQFNGLRFAHPLDFVGTAENEHITIKAPEGMYFSPCHRIAKETGKVIKEEDSKFGDSFYISDEMIDHESNNTVKDEGRTKSSNVSQIVAYGTLTPGYATLKTAMNWWGENDEHLYRRLPVEGSEEHQYSVNLLLRPKLGLRAIGYMIFIALSALVFIVCYLCPAVYVPPSTSGVETDFSLGSLFLLAPLMMMLIVNRDEEPFIRKHSFRFPTKISNICKVLDVSGFLFFMLIGLKVITLDTCISGLVALALSIICTICFVCCLMWSWRHEYEKSKWTKRHDAFNSFPVIVAPIDPRIFRI